MPNGRPSGFFVGKREMECILVWWPTAFFTIAWGNAPGSTKNTVRLGQGPCSIGHVSIAYGRWPNRFLSFSGPGAMPLATINMAFGQQSQPQTRNFKTRQRVPVDRDAVAGASCLYSTIPGNLIHAARLTSNLHSRPTAPKKGLFTHLLPRL